MMKRACMQRIFCISMVLLLASTTFPPVSSNRPPGPPYVVTITVYGLAGELVEGAVVYLNNTDSGESKSNTTGVNGAVSIALGGKYCRDGDLLRVTAMKGGLLGQRNFHARTNEEGIQEETDNVSVTLSIVEDDYEEEVEDRSYLLLAILGMVASIVLVMVLPRYLQKMTREKEEKPEQPPRPVRKRTR